MNPNEIPIETQGQLSQEYTYSSKGCTVNQLVQEIYNNDYREVDGNFEISLGELEEKNFITQVLDGIIN